MKTKSPSAKSAAKANPKKEGTGSKLASSLKNAIFGSGKKKQLDKAPLPKNMKASKSTPSKTAATKTAAAPKAAKPSAKIAAVKTIPAKTTAKTAPPKNAAPAKATVLVKGKAGIPPKVPTSAKTATAKAPVGKGASKAATKQAAGKSAAAVAVVVVPPPKPLYKTPKKTPISPLLAQASRSRRSLEDVCREVACEGLATTSGYCRLHYIKNWKKIKRKEIILKEGKLNQYIEELVIKYPDKYIEAIRQDLESDEDFAKVVKDLDLDESADDFDADGENVDQIIDTIKRDFEDDEGGF